MRRKVATLEVYIDDEDVKTPSGLAMARSNKDPTEVEDNKYEILLTPNYPHTKKQGGLLTTFAHELGHFVACVLKTPVSNKAVRNDFKLREKERSARPSTPDEISAAIRARKMPWDRFYEPTQDEVRENRVAHYHEEKEAWQIGQLIRPDLNEALANFCLDTYNPEKRRSGCGKLHLHHG
jgi:hypothetical protein